jgi:hypothetical protein
VSKRNTDFRESCLFALLAMLVLGAAVKPRNMIKIKNFQKDEK